MYREDQMNAAVRAVCQKNGIPVDQPVAKALLESIKMRDSSHEEKIDATGKIDYAQTMDNFKRCLTPSLQEKLFQVLDEAIAKSIKSIDERAEKLNSDKAYHKSPHHQELASDTSRVAKKMIYKGASSANPTLEKLAELAAACHDLIQEETKAVENERKSKDKFVEYATKAIDIFLYEQKNIPNFKQLQTAAESLKKQLDFIGQEIIVNGTYLVITNNFSTRKPLLHYVTEVDKLLAGAENAENVSINYTNKLMTHNRDLYAVATIVSLYDTSRTLDREIGEMQISRKFLESLPEKNQKVMMTLLEALGGNNPINQELALLRLGQNLRMMVETNKFLKGRDDANEMTVGEVNDFVALFKASFRETASENEFLSKCNNDNIHNILKKFNGRTPGEVAFARSLDFSDHQSLAETYGQAQIFSHMDPQGWVKHADTLASGKFQKWYEGLTAEEKNTAAETFMLLGSLGQPGLQMIKQKEPVKSIHAEFDNIVIISEAEKQAHTPAVMVGLVDNHKL